jgi:hypothetical protein
MGGRLLALVACTTAALSLPVAIGSAGAVRAPRRVTYHLEPVAETLRTRYTEEQLRLLEKINRRDLEHLVRLKEIIVPDEWVEDELAYSPLPPLWVWASTAPKAIVVHQPSQLFGAYEAGRIVRWGPISSGRKETPTPAGVFNLTWKSKSRTSTDNDQWLLKWYFNFVNSRGVSFHQFDLPGTAASHACVRLLERDAQWLYGWGEQWTLSADRRTIVTPGTPVVVIGEYDFGKPPPWSVVDWWRAPIELPADPKR